MTSDILTSGGRGRRRRPLRSRERQQLTGQIVSRLGAGVVDADLKHRKTALQFDRAVLCAFFGAELGLKSSIDFEGKTGFRRFDRSAGHSESKVIGGSVCTGYGESGTSDKPVLKIVEGVAS